MEKVSTIIWSFYINSRIINDFAEHYRRPFMCIQTWEIIFIHFILLFLIGWMGEQETKKIIFINILNDFKCFKHEQCESFNGLKTWYSPSQRIFDYRIIYLHWKFYVWDVLFSWNAYYRKSKNTKRPLIFFENGIIFS